MEKETSKQSADKISSQGTSKEIPTNESVLEKKKQEKESTTKAVNTLSTQPEKKVENTSSIPDKKGVHH